MHSAPSQPGSWVKPSVMSSCTNILLNCQLPAHIFLQTHHNLLSECKPMAISLFKPLDSFSSHHGMMSRFSCLLWDPLHHIKHSSTRAVLPSPSQKQPSAPPTLPHPSLYAFTFVWPSWVTVPLISMKYNCSWLCSSLASPLLQPHHHCLMGATPSPEGPAEIPP